MATRTTGAIYLFRDKFQIFIPGMRQVLEFRFVPEIVRDLDVVNRDMFINLVKVFVANAKLPPSNLVIAIADNAAIIKDFISPPPAAGKTAAAGVPVEELQKQAD